MSKQLNKPYAHLRKTGFNRQRIRTNIWCPAGKNIHSDALNMIDLSERNNGQIFIRYLLQTDATKPQAYWKDDLIDADIDYLPNDPQEMEIFVYLFNDLGANVYPNKAEYETLYIGKTVIHRDDEDEKDDD